jgi:hypothetical protein
MTSTCPAGSITKIGQGLLGRAHLALQPRQQVAWRVQVWRDRREWMSETVYSEDKAKGQLGIGKSELPAC